MAADKFRRAVGLIKDRTSISIAKVAGKSDRSLQVLVVKATSHDAGAIPCESIVEEIVERTWLSKPCAYSFVSFLFRRLERTRDWIVALKALILVHRLVVEGGKAVKEEIAYASGGRLGGLLYLSGFMDEAHSNSWDYSEYVRSYAVYLAEKVRVMADADEIESHGGGIRSESRDAERIFGRMRNLQGLLDRVLSCRPVGLARANRIVIAAFEIVVTDSFEIYGEVCEGLSYLLDWFPELGFESSTMALELYVRAARQIDELFEYYKLCRDVGIGSPASYPEVDKINDDLLKSLEEFLKMKMSGSRKSNENDARLMLPPPILSDFDELANSSSDQVNLEKNARSADDEVALTVGSDRGSGEESDWEVALVEVDFDELAKSSSDQVNMRNNPRSAEDEVDWEVALVESAIDMARQREEVVLEVDEALMNPIPGLPERVVGEDPFAASDSVEPPLYVQMADMERKRRLMVQEQQLWRQFGGVSQSVVNHNWNGKPGGYYY